MIKIIKPKVEIIDAPKYKDLLQKIELCGRTCYKSEDRITKGSAERFIKMIIKRGHESVLEHGSITVRFIGSRSMSHQAVRHRLFSPSQESQRFCNYNKNNNLIIICPLSIQKDEQFLFEWMQLIREIYAFYNKMIHHGFKPEDARSVLPNATKTDLVMTGNIRQWRHFFKMRCDIHAQEEIRTLARDLLKKFKKKYPVFFEDLSYE